MVIRMSGTGAPGTRAGGPAVRGPRVVVRFYRGGQWEATVTLFGRDAAELADMLVRAAEARGYRLLDKVQGRFYYLIRGGGDDGAVQ